MTRIAVVAGVMLASVACGTGTRTLGSVHLASAVIGPAGGTFAVTPNEDGARAGTSIVVPPGALAKSTTIWIDGSSEAVAPTGTSAAGPVVQFGPDGLVFARPVTITLPTSPGLPAGRQLLVAAVEADGSRRQLFATATLPGFASVLAPGFTRFGVFDATNDGGPGGGPCDDSCGACTQCYDNTCIQLAGCTIAPDGGQLCQTDFDCPDDWECVQGACVPRPVPALLSIALPDSAIPAGSTEQATADLSFSDGTTESVSSLMSWTTSDPSIASVSSGGLVTGLAAGTVTIAGTVDGLTATAQLTVGAPAPVALVLSPQAAVCSVGQELLITVTVVYSDGSSAVVTDSATWDLVSAGAVRETSAGVFSCLTVGTATVGASYPGAPGLLSAVETVTVEVPGLVSITITPAVAGGATISAGTTRSFIATGTYSDGTTMDLTNQVTWSISDDTVASVSPSGLVTGLAQGSAILTVTTGGITGSLTVTVLPGCVSLTVMAQRSGTLPLGSSEQLSVICTFSDGTTGVVATNVVWSVAPATSATITSEGVLTGIAQGTVFVTAAVGAISQIISVTIVGPVVVALTIDSSISTLAVGQTEQIVGTATLSDGATSALSGATWTSSDTAVATVSSAGVITGISAGSATITIADQEATTTFVVNVTQVTCVSLSVSGFGGPLPVGVQEPLQATCTFSDGSVGAVTSSVAWTVAPASAASISTSGILTGLTPAPPGAVSSSGFVWQGLWGGAVLYAVGSVVMQGGIAYVAQEANFAAAPAASVAAADGTWTLLPAGIAFVTASLGSVVDTVTITVGSPVPVSIIITPTNPSVPLIEAIQLTAIATYSDATTQDVTASATWVSDNTDMGTVSAGGLFQTISEGITNVTATLGGVSGTTSVTVGPIVLLSIAITPMNPSLPLGETEQLTVTGFYSDGSEDIVTDEVTWSLSDGSVIGIDEGLLKTLAQGTATVMASLRGVSASFVVTVGPPALEQVIVAPANATVPLGEAIQVTATAIYTDGSTPDVTTLATWSVDDQSVVAISARGYAQTITTGIAHVTATLGGISGTAEVTVVPPVLVSITVGPSSATVPVGETLQLTAVGTYGDGSTIDVTARVGWSITGSGTATVDAAGLIQTLAPGSETVTATLDGVSGSTTVTIGPPAIGEIVISPANPSVPIGENLQLTATVDLTDGSSQNVTAQATWSSADAGVVTVTAAGLTQSVSQGTATITASWSGVMAEITVTVMPAVLVSIAVTPADLNLPLGETEQMTATGTFSDGSTQDVTTAAVWSSSQGGVATVDAGDATASGQGSSIVTASVGAISGFTTVFVGPALLVAVLITPADPTCSPGGTVQLSAVGEYSDGSQSPVACTGWALPDNTTDSEVTTGGLVQCGEAGSSTVTLACEAVTATANVTIQ